MTCIVSLEYNGHIYMGSDSAASNEDRIDIISSSKIIQKKNLIIGYSSSFRVGQIIEYNLIISKKKKTDKWLYTDFIKNLRKILEINGAKDFQNGDSISGNSEFLIGFNGKLYLLQSDFSIIRSNCGYAAIGSGADIAYGALYATDKIADPYGRLNIALEAAAKWAPSVAPPFHFIKL